MSVSRVRVDFDRPGGGWDVSRGQKQPVITVEIVVGYTIWVTSSDDHESTIMASSLLPRPNGIYSANGLVRCVSARFRRTRNSLVWKGTFTFRSDAPSEEPSEDPTQWAPRWERDSIVEQTHPQVDLDEHAFVNSAGDTFLNGVAVAERRPRHRVTCWRREYDETHCQTYENHYNSVAYTIKGKSYPAKTVLLESVRITQEPINGEMLCKYTYEFVINLAKDDAGAYIGWNEYKLDAGFQAWNSDGSRKERIVDDNGIPVGSEVPLDGNGKKRGLQDQMDGKYYYRTFRVFDGVDFAGIGLS